MTPEQLDRLLKRLAGAIDSGHIPQATIGIGIAIDFIFEELDGKKHLDTPCEEQLERARSYATTLQHD